MIKQANFSLLIMIEKIQLQKKKHGKNGLSYKNLTINFLNNDDIYNY